MRSAASSTSRPPEPLTFFLDESQGGASVVAALRDAGALIERLWRAHDSDSPGLDHREGAGQRLAALVCEAQQIHTQRGTVAHRVTNIDDAGCRSRGSEDKLPEVLVFGHQVR